MARVDLTNSIKSAMSAPAVRAAHEPLPSAAVGAPAPARAPRPRTLRGLLFGRFADYARRYLTASVEHRITQMQTDLAEIRARTDRMGELLGVVHQIESLTAAQIGYGAEQREMLTAQLWQARDDLAQRIEGVPGALGPRFDELEVKVRPVLDYDAASWAVRLREGYAMVPKDQPAFALAIANASSGGLEPGTRSVLRALIQPGMTVADVGANIGLLTLACATATGPTGKVYAFEPEPGPRVQLAKTLYVNGLSWVEVLDCAVGAKRAKLTFHVSPIIGHSSLYALPAEEGEASSFKVQVRPLDEVVPKGATLDVVKIDVEGAELDVLAGMPRLLADNRDIAVVAEYGPAHLARVGITPEAWFAAFDAAGFTAYEIDEGAGTCRPTSPAALAEAVSVNLAFVRPGGAAEGRLPL